MEMHDCHVDHACDGSVLSTLASGRLSEGELVKRFEEKLSSRLGLKNPVCVNSGTSALHLALVLAGVKTGDEVILPPQTFLATGMAVLYCGATPVFADVDPETGNIDPESVANLIIPGMTKAVLAVDWAGYPYDAYDIQSMCCVDDMLVIEDAAHALGAIYNGRPVGLNSSITCFSFQAIKHLTTGDGGAVCSRAYSLIASARKYRWFGIDRDEEPGLLGERESLISRVGYKYHMNDVAAAIGLGNLNGIEGRLQRRRDIGTRYRRELVDIPGVRLLRSEPDRTHAYWIFGMRVERRDDFVRALRGRGVPSSVVNRRIDRHPVFGGLRRDLPGMELFDAEQINLPTHSALTDEDVDEVIAAVKEGW